MLIGEWIIDLAVGLMLLIILYGGIVFLATVVTLPFVTDATFLTVFPCLGVGILCETLLKIRMFKRTGVKEKTIS